MARTKESSFTVGLPGGVDCVVEKGYADQIDTSFGVGISNSALSIYDGQFVSDLYFWENDLNVSSSDLQDILYARDKILGDYQIFGSDDIDAAINLPIFNGSNALTIDFSGGFTAFTDHRPPPYLNYGYLSFNFERGWEYKLDFDNLASAAGLIVMAAILILCAFLVATYGAASVGGAIATGIAITLLVEVADAI